MKGIFILFLILSALHSFAQKKIICDGLKSIAISGSVVINGKPPKNEISKSDLLRYDLQIILSDTNYKIVGFIASYDCHSRSLLFDINERTYFGDRINGDDTFLRHVWVGDILSIECINIKRNVKTFLIAGVWFNVIE